MSFIVSACLIAVATSVACALPGVFVVLRKDSMLVDAMGHAVLPGIVTGYAITGTLGSPWLMVGAAVSGLCVVFASEALRHSSLVTGDAPLGLVFPALFSLGIILLHTVPGVMRLDTRSVLVGDLNLVALSELNTGSISWGPVYLYVMLAVALVNTVFITVLYPRLCAAAFDPAAAAAAGLRPRLVSLLLMFSLALTVSASFAVAGALLSGALVVVPAAAAILVRTRVSHVIVTAVGIAGVGAVMGFWISYVIDAPTSAGMALCYGLLFLVAMEWRRRARGPVAAVAQDTPPQRSG